MIASHDYLFFLFFEAARARFTAAFQVAFPCDDAHLEALDNTADADTPFPWLRNLTAEVHDF